MKEKREKIMPVVDLLEYMIRRGKISNAGGHKIYAVVLENPDLVKQVMNILDDDLVEEEMLARVQRLV